MIRLALRNLTRRPMRTILTMTAQDIVLLFRRISSEYATSILLVTHNPGVAKVATRSLKMRNGQLALSWKEGASG